MDKLVELFTAEAVWEMPPFDGWYQGPENIVLLSKTHCPAENPGDMRLIRTTANGQPAGAMYMLNRETVCTSPSDACLAATADGISHVVAFHMESFEATACPGPSSSSRSDLCHAIEPNLCINCGSGRSAANRPSASHPAHERGSRRSGSAGCRG